MSINNKWNVKQTMWAYRLMELKSKDNNEMRYRKNPNLKLHEERKMWMNLCRKKIDSNQ